MAFLYVRGNAGVFFILGKGSGADDLIAALEGRDVASEQGARNIVPANSEALVKVNPDVILTMRGAMDKIIPQLKAVAQALGVQEAGDKSPSACRKTLIMP